MLREVGSIPIGATMRNRILNVATAVFLVAGIVMTWAGSAGATTLTTTPAGHDSCLFGIKESGSFSTTYGATGSYTFKVKCYFDPGSTGGFAGTAPSSWLLPAASTTLSSPVYIYFNSTTTPSTISTLLMNPSTYTGAVGTARWTWSNYTVKQSAPGFIDFELYVTRNGQSFSGFNPSTLQTVALCFSPGTSQQGCQTGTTTGVYMAGEMTQGTHNATHTKWVSGSTIQDPTVFPDYRWGSAFSYNNFCGADLSVPLVSASTTLVQGNVYPYTVNVTAGRTSSVYIQYPGQTSKTANIPLYNVLGGSVAVAGSFSGNLTVNMGALALSSRHTWAEVKLWCFETTTQLWFSVPFGTNVANANTGRSRPCDIARWYWPQNRDVAVGDSLTWHLSYSGLLDPSITDNTVKVEWAAYDQSASVTPTVAGMSWSTVAASIPLGTEADYSLSAPYAGDVMQFRFRCTDALGTTYAYQWIASARMVTQPDDPDAEQACYSNSGIGINPKSWVPAAGRMGGCVMRVLFVPQGPVWDDLQASFEDSVIGEATDAVGGVVTFAQTMGSTSSGSCAGSSVDLPLGGTKFVTTSFMDACSGPAATIRDVVYTMGTVMLYIAGAFAIANAALSLIGAETRYRIDSAERQEYAESK